MHILQTKRAATGRLLRAAIVLLVLIPSPKPRAQDRSGEESANYYQRWLEGYVAYLVTDQERAVFERLTTDAERESFIEEFWRRRDPNPATVENEFKTEHYRRVAYANEKFSATIPGWKTDRGKTYIKYGPPAEIDVHPTGTILKDTRGGSIQGLTGDRLGARPREIRTYPFEVWRYRYLEGLGSDIEIEFVDKTGAGIYTLAMDEDEKNVFAFKDPAADVASPLQSEFLKTEKQRRFHRTELLAGLAAPPPVRFRDLREVVSSRVHYADLAFAISTAVFRESDRLFRIPITLSVPAAQLQFESGLNGVEASVNLFLQVSNVQKRVVFAAEDTLKLPDGPGEISLLPSGTALYQTAVSLPPGRYLVDVVVKDSVSDKLGTVQRLVVVDQPESSPWMSSLIVADSIQPSHASEVDNHPFRIGSHRVIPNVQARFSRSKGFGVFFQVYGLTIDQASSRPDAETRLRFSGPSGVLLELGDDLSRFGVVDGNNATVSVTLPLARFPLGVIDLEVEVRDKISRRTTTSNTQFQVIP